MKIVDNWIQRLEQHADTGLMDDEFVLVKNPPDQLNDIAELASYPALFCYFTSAYTFSEFSYQGIVFWTNVDHFAKYFPDKLLDNVLVSQKYLPFGQPDCGGYDRICFDMNRKRGRDAPIIRIDHEAMLLKGDVRVIETLYPNFLTLMEA